MPKVVCHDEVVWRDTAGHSVRCKRWWCGMMARAHVPAPGFFRSSHTHTHAPPTPLHMHLPHPHTCTFHARTHAPPTPIPPCRHLVSSRLPTPIHMHMHMHIHTSSSPQHYPVPPPSPSAQLSVAQICSCFMYLSRLGRRPAWVERHESAVAAVRGQRVCSVMSWPACVQCHESASMGRVS